MSRNSIMKVGQTGPLRIRNASAKNTSKRFHWAKLKTQKQAERANRLYFGTPVGTETYLAQKVKVHVDARPFMHPAYAKNTTPAKLSKCFKDTIR